MAVIVLLSPRNDPLAAVRRVSGHALVAARELFGMSRIDVADRLQVTPQAVGRWERGETLPRDRHRLQLADLYRTDVSVLFPMRGSAA